jgi:hypothetical protein
MQEMQVSSKAAAYNFFTDSPKLWVETLEKISREYGLLETYQPANLEVFTNKLGLSLNSLMIDTGKPIKRVDLNEFTDLAFNRARKIIQFGDRFFEIYDEYEAVKRGIIKKPFQRGGELLIVSNDEAILTLEGNGYDYDSIKDLRNPYNGRTGHGVNTFDLHKGKPWTAHLKLEGEEPSSYVFEYFNTISAYYQNLALTWDIEIKV